eukprot:CAMPEP_0167740560 /NCGR_PEP_ID=MMETSP0110_2-20121227/351_1 /TAXON_ID=629695 /ORGANISM="Gymnochlora sp., Strain CCMP2014" /LENGTH=145 /DNA_ID=CAMNT_0007624479 /DNA_START=227 /DNA_END=664 /DNA_ORIENTATION=+
MSKKSPSVEPTMPKPRLTKVGKIPRALTHSQPRPSKLTANVYDNPKSLVIACDVPGVKKEDIKISIKNDILTVTGRRRQVNISAIAESGPVKELVAENLPGNFTRSFRVPDTIDVSAISAVQLDGVLTITMMKKPEEKPIQIPIS